MRSVFKEGATNAPGVEPKKGDAQDDSVENSPVKSGTDLQADLRNTVKDPANFRGLDSKEAATIKAIIDLIIKKSTKGSTGPTLDAVNKILQQKTQSIKEEEGQLQLNTYGDLKNLIKAVAAGEKKKKIVSKAGEIAIDQILGLIPGASNAKTVVDFIKTATKKPDTKKTNTVLDKFDIDDNTSAIVDDAIENGFIDAVAKEIEKEPNDKPLEQDYSMNAKLANYLKAKYSDHYVAPEKSIQKEHNSGEFCPQCLAEYIKAHYNLIVEAEYKGRKVQLGKPFLTPDGPKKRAVYVKNAKGNVVKVNFGQKGVAIKKHLPKHRKSYRARHHCDTNPGPRWKANYWSCKFW